MSENPKLADVFCAFRGSEELAKKLIFAAIVCEVSAGILAACRYLLGNGNLKYWDPFMMLALIVVASLVRVWSQRVGTRAQRYRRITIHGFALGLNVGAEVVSSILSDVSSLSRWLAKLLPAQSLQEYYEPTRVEGYDRLRELYAESAFFTWRIQREGGRAMLGLGVLIFLGGFGAVYKLAATEDTVSNVAGGDARQLILQVICSTVFALLAARFIKEGMVLILSASDCRRIQEKLCDPGDSGHAELDDLTSQYDIHRASTPRASTFIYRVNREKLTKQWARLRESLPGGVGG